MSRKPTRALATLTESGSRGRMGPVGDSEVGPHSVQTPGWNSYSCSSLRMTVSVKSIRERLNVMPRSWYSCFKKMSSQSFQSPAFVVWSLGGMVSLLAFCLCHFICPTLVSFQPQSSLSNVQEPEREPFMRGVTLTYALCIATQISANQEMNLGSGSLWYYKTQEKK